MSWEIRQGDALDRLRDMPAGSFQTCITSPPYFGLRDYGHDGQIGLEPTPDEYVASLVAAFREVRQVLRDDGTLWLNLGDSYAGSGPSGASYQSETTKRRAAGDGQDGAFRVAASLGERGLSYAEKKPIAPPGFKPKDLMGIPWMVAFALRADGWWLRSEIIWHKPNPMPESVTDRPTRAHEQVFLLSKSRSYFYDAEAIKEPAEYAGPNGAQHSPYGQGFTRRSDKQRETGEQRIKGGDRYSGFNESGRGHDLTRNKRSVWTVATRPYPEAHFATFPPQLVEPMVLAGSPLDGMVLDPFAGAGTTGLVALRHQRSFIGIELNPDYCKLARNRLREDQPMFNVPGEVAA